MTYRFSVEIKPTYLHATGSGEQTEANARQFLIDAYRACLEHHMSRLLLEMRFSGKALSVAGAYSVIVERSHDGSMLKSIAYVDANPAHGDEMAEFATLIAKNRGVNMPGFFGYMLWSGAILIPCFLLLTWLFFR